MQVEDSAPSRVPAIPTKPSRLNSDWRTGIRAATFLSRVASETKPAAAVPDKPLPFRETSRPKTADPGTRKPDYQDFAHFRMGLESAKGQDASSIPMLNVPDYSVRPTSSRTSSPFSSGQEETYEEALNTVEGLAVEENQSTNSSLYSKDSSSIYSRDSASIYSDASSVYSSAASTYSCDEYGFKDFERITRQGTTELILEEDEESVLPSPSLYQQRTSTVPVRRDAQDTASREASSLAKKAALFKNSRLPRQLPSFNASLPTWALISRAVLASRDCYESQRLTRRGTFTPASKNIKAMIIDDQFIDESRLLIVSVRGTECKSLADWAVNKDSKPARPVGFLDDEENACHAGFLQVTKAMVDQVAAQLQSLPPSLEKPSLLFTGHSAGGAISAMLYTHILSISVQSDLTKLASQFSSINCITFGAPPLFLEPLPIRNHGSGVFLAFANQGDPVLRLSDAAYVKSLAKLMTASPPASTVDTKLKVVRRSRGTSVIREVAGPATPWEELPLWPTPPPPLTNAGEVILLRDNENGKAVASRVTPEDMKGVIFADLAQHPIGMYIRRVEKVALAAMVGRM